MVRAPTWTCTEMILAVIDHVFRYFPAVATVLFWPCAVPPIVGAFRGV
jgi:hypothetical protein